MRDGRVLVGKECGGGRERKSSSAKPPNSLTTSALIPLNSKLSSKHLFYLKMSIKLKYLRVNTGGERLSELRVESISLRSIT